MKFSISNILQGVLILAAAGLLAVLLIPWGDRSPKVSAVTSPAQVAVDHAGAQTAPSLASPDAVLSLFLGMNPKTSQTGTVTTTVEKKAADAPWLKYLGFYSGVSGRPSYLLKDARSGRVIKVTEGSPADGWSLVKAGDGRMIIRHNDDEYVVDTR